jgi:hypothetical protein
MSATWTNSACGDLAQELARIDRIIRNHSTGHSQVSLDVWLSHSTLSRFRDWVPAPAAGEQCLLDIGCYQPSIGYDSDLGWRRVVGIAKEEGECNAKSSYCTENGTEVVNLIADVEIEKIPLPDSSVDTVLMMEIFEHFGLDPMHALLEPIGY